MKAKGAKAKPERTCGTCDHFAQSACQRRRRLGVALCHIPLYEPMEIRADSKCHFASSAWTPIGGRRARAAVPLGDGDEWRAR